MTDKIYSYSFLALNRGLVISILAPMSITAIIFIFIITGLEVNPNLPLVSTFFFIFAGIHIYWDFKIKSHHKNIKVHSNHVEFISGNRENIKIFKEDILSIEIFPTVGNVYDKDYVTNIMSSGIRFNTKKGTFLIFNKIKMFKEIVERINFLTVNQD